MDHVLIIHAVRDSEAWKRVFDAAAPIRREAGERSFQVLRDASDPNQVEHFSHWDSIARAKALFESPQLVAIRRQAVVESPDFFLFASAGGGHALTAGAFPR